MKSIHRFLNAFCALWAIIHLLWIATFVNGLKISELFLNSYSIFSNA